jgi:hypothetical protein
LHVKSIFHAGAEISRGDKVEEQFLKNTVKAIVWE